MSTQKVSVKRKGYMDSDANTELKIVFSLFKSGIPLKMIDIAKRCNLPRQLVSYHIPKLVGKGLVIPNSDGTYMAQPALVRDDLLIEKLVPLIEQIASTIELGHVQDIEDAVYNVMQYFLLFHTLEW